MSFFNRTAVDVKPKTGTKGAPVLPRTESPDVAPRTPPPMSPARAAAVQRAIERGEARSVAHALFKHSAGILLLPD